MIAHNIDAAVAISQELGFTVATEDAEALVRYIRNAYHRGASDALPMHNAFVADAVAAEREACAQVLDAMAAESEADGEYSGYARHYRLKAAEIRARGAA